MPHQDQVLVALRRIIRATDQNSKRLSRTAGLTIPQSVLMRAIAAHPGATLGFLTSQVSLSQATVTTILDRLEERELVVRSRGSQDKRVVNVALTEAGSRLLEGSPTPLQADFQARFEQLTPAQRDRIVDSLQHVAAMMGAGDIDAAPMLTLGNIPEQFPRRSPVPINAATAADNDVQLRAPTIDDGTHVQALIRICPPLDQNSLYANLLQCTHFRDTCVVATSGNQVVGFISGYLLPNRNNTLFIWQVAVHPSQRGRGLAQRMLDNLLARDACAHVCYLETTVTPDNTASAALFAALARSRQAALSRQLLFDRQRHLKGSHDSEWLLHVGPFTSADGTANQNPAPEQEARPGA